MWLLVGTRRPTPTSEGFFEQGITFESRVTIHTNSDIIPCWCVYFYIPSLLQYFCVAQVLDLGNVLLSVMQNGKEQS